MDITKTGRKENMKCTHIEGTPLAFLLVMIRFSDVIDFKCQVCESIKEDAELKNP